MILFLSSQDIHKIEAGLLSEDGLIVKHAFKSASPEEFLQTIVGLMQSWEVDWKDIDKVIVVTGPGSFTATRIIVTIANTVSFARSIPIVGIENPEKKNMSQLLENLSVKEMLDSAKQEFVSVVYASGPGITESKKWSLEDSGQPDK